MAFITLQHPDVNSGNPMRVMGVDVQLIGRSKLDTEPNVNILESGMAEVSKQGVDHIRYSLQNVNIQENPNEITYVQFLQLYKSKFTGSNPITLIIPYKDGNLPNYDEATTGIKCVVDTFNLAVSNSTDRMNTITGSIVFRETGTS